MMGFTLIIGCSYFLLIFLFWLGWESLPTYHVLLITNHPLVSVIIPMRNESKNIQAILHCLYQQHYPSTHLEIILVDDHSTDDTVARISQFKASHVRVLQLSSDMHGKKAALQKGIEASKGELILMTDADCLMTTSWVSCYVSYYQQFHPVMMLGPVCAMPCNTLFSEMQALEMYSLLGSTAGAAAIHHHIMCNGANMAISRKIYPAIQHIYSNSQVRSGDDVFVMETLKKTHRSSIHFIKARELTVTTSMCETLAALISQRKRWASKAPLYKDADIIITGLIVMLMNIGLLSTLIYGLIRFEFNYFLLLLLLKSMTDGIILYRTTSFFKEKKLMRWFPIVQSIYFVYVSFTALLAVFSSGSWKNRIIKY